jgi:D-serine deaminase-like pyridoxal phosphate-dependent protein
MLLAGRSSNKRIAAVMSASLGADRGDDVHREIDVGVGRTGCRDRTVGDHHARHVGRHPRESATLIGHQA